MNTELGSLLAATLPTGAVRTRATERFGMAHDASHFARTPKAVVTVSNAREVAALFRGATIGGVPLTFRSGGTSLSGQAVTDGILADTRRHFRQIEVLEEGARVRVGPGVTVRQANAQLARFGRVLGPDPASEVACTLGGVVANNSSGMACGTVANSYTLVESLVLVLPSGTVLDTGSPDADDRLHDREPELWAGLARIRDRVRNNPTSRARIEQQFSLKNTMGYGINALLDHERPVDILTRLVVGSEGTLAFIASIVMRTVPLHSHTRTGLLIFPDLPTANGALPELLETAPATAELLDATSLRVGQNDPAANEGLRKLTVRDQAALLVEYRGATAEEADARASDAAALIERLPLEGMSALTADPSAKAALWTLRKGLYAKIAGARPAGTAALLEDIAVPVPALLPTCETLTGLFAKYGYQHAVIFGHAKDGNIHFMLTEQLSDASGRDRLARFTDDMVDLVLGHNGTLKAEHGTGRMMTPFVRRQYGAELYGVMREIKRLCDPRGVLSPGVILSDDPRAHLADLKSAPPVEEEVDRCVECGFCEPVCPSRDLTTTPRQRIALRRDLEQARRDGDRELVAELEADHDYAVVDTCAVDGMCQTACPVMINTGDLVRRLRAERPGRLSTIGWSAAASHWSTITRSAGAVLAAAHRLPRAVTGVTDLARRIGNADTIPRWSADLPAGGGHRIPQGLTTTDEADAILFASCTGTMFGSAGLGAGTAFARLCQRAGVRLAVPTDLPSLCCGTPWKSKGMSRGLGLMADRVLPALLQSTDNGRIPVLVDASSCTEGLRQLFDSSSGVRVLDAVEFTATHLLDRLTISEPISTLALHPTCSAQRARLTAALTQVAEAVAVQVTIPDSWGCCGFAGDRGLLHPELTAAATGPQSAELADRHFDAYASCNRTCELGMTRATGHAYVHVLELLEHATRPMEVNT